MHEVGFVLGLEQPFGGAAALEPDQRRQRRVRRKLATDLRHRRDGAHLLALALPMPSASAPAHLVMSPAPMQMIMSPSAARSLSSPHNWSRLSTVRTIRWPCARSPSASAAESTPSIGSSPAG